jgi:anti-sigma regulatory factor (Ser/Thr protein kinase)
MHVHQYLQMHILGGIVAEVPASRRLICPFPEVSEMSGNHPTAILRDDGRVGREPPSAGLREQRLPGAMMPAARLVCRQVASHPLDTGLASKAAREFTGQTLSAWGLLTLAEDAAVIVSELVTNALRHGARGMNGAVHDRIELILWRRAGQVVCAVTDPGSEPPMLAEPDALAEAGRGLHVVQALSANWGWTRLHGRRKAVWAALSDPGTDAGDTPVW